MTSECSATIFPGKAPMQLTTRSRYGLRMLLDIALHGAGGPVRIQDIAQRRKIP
jgi:DNA-binding IscR family transcriptional regulator